MFISIKELQQEKLDFDEKFRPGSIDFGPDLHQIEPLLTSGRAEVLHEHRGAKQVIHDVRVVGRLATKMEVACARCLDPVVHAVSSDFDLLYRPLGVDRRGDEVSINQAETEISYYDGEGILLEDVLREQVLLALPIRTVCGEACKGLCPKCGGNLNAGGCDCAAAVEDPRWGALKEWKNKLKRP
jgi:uncharacterized protein